MGLQPAYHKCINTFTPKILFNHTNPALPPFSIQREYFTFLSFHFFILSVFLIEVIRASQQFNCLEGKDATPPTLFIYLTTFKDTFVIQQSLKSVTTTTCHSYYFVLSPSFYCLEGFHDFMVLKKLRNWCHFIKCFLNDDP